MVVAKSIIAVSALLVAAQAEMPSGKQVEAGHKFALMVCGACHVVAGRSDNRPIRRPPGPSFVALAQRPSLTEQWLRDFLGSNHRDIGPADAMPNPRLADYQIDEIVAYVMSLKAAK